MRVAVMDLIRAAAGVAASVICILALVYNAIGKDHTALQALIWAFALLMLSQNPTHRSKGE